MKQNEKRSIGQRWDELQPSKTVLAWACVATVAATLVVGFGWGGWVTGGTARAMADDAAAEGRGQLAAAICAESFMTASDAAVQLVALKEIDSSYQQRRFVQDGGWAVMPGSDSPDRRAVELCAEDLAKREVGQTANVTPPTAQ